MERQFTATVYVIYEERALLHRHPKFGKWLPAGGHLEANETPPEAGLREVKEETGLEIAFFDQENLNIDALHAKSFPRPFLCLLEEIPARGNLPAHQHVDFIYVGYPLTEPSPLLPNGFHWFSYEELRGIEEELFSDTKQVLEQLLLKPPSFKRRLNPLKGPVELLAGDNEGRG